MCGVGRRSGKVENNQMNNEITECQVMSGDLTLLEVS